MVYRGITQLVRRSYMVLEYLHIRKLHHFYRNYIMREDPLAREDLLASLVRSVKQISVGPLKRICCCERDLLTLSTDPGSAHESFPGLPKPGPVSEVQKRLRRTLCSLLKKTETPDTSIEELYKHRQDLYYYSETLLLKIIVLLSSWALDTPWATSRPLLFRPLWNIYSTIYLWPFLAPFPCYFTKPRNLPKLSKTSSINPKNNLTTPNLIYGYFLAYFAVCVAGRNLSLASRLLKCPKQRKHVNIALLILKGSLLQRALFLLRKPMCAHCLHFGSGDYNVSKASLHRSFFLVNDSIRENQIDLQWALGSQQHQHLLSLLCLSYLILKKKSIKNKIICLIMLKIPPCSLVSFSCFSLGVTWGVQTPNLEQARYKRWILFMQYTSAFSILNPPYPPGLIHLEMGLLYFLSNQAKEGWYVHSARNLNRAPLIKRRKADRFWQNTRDIRILMITRLGFSLSVVFRLGGLNSSP
ncbi:hypothetical protein VP01_1639g3 [Puccinia sorghi]|uniref:Uncharacterized protein n=1 Tax=Puccinia sorghi TaxID=27349 RepID=A0A0L6VGP6_9BASI|nr:hypothetical protein VP01_1639g3 [Puccinia sorghi]